MKTLDDANRAEATLAEVERGFGILIETVGGRLRNVPATEIAPRAILDDVRGWVAEYRRLSAALDRLSDPSKAYGVHGIERARMKKGEAFEQIRKWLVLLRPSVAALSPQEQVEFDRYTDEFASDEERREWKEVAEEFGRLAEDARRVRMAEIRRRQMEKW